MLLFSMALWFVGYIGMDGEKVFFSILAGLMFTGLLLGNLYLSYYYHAKKQTGFRIVVILLAWSINYALLHPLLALLFVLTNISLFYYNLRYLVSSANTDKLEYPLTFYSKNQRVIPNLIILISSSTYWFCIYYLSK